MLICGNSYIELDTLAENSIDTVITDPPYGLRFMGKKWDYDIPRRAFWEKVLRVCKPGAFMLVFGGTRTYHRLAVEIEDAGFEIRDCIMWLYGQGFPKSLDISKAIDKSLGETREIMGVKTHPFTNKPNSILSKDNRTEDENGYAISNITKPASKEAELWDGWGTALKPAWEPILVCMKPIDGTFAHNALEYGVAGLNIDGTRIETNDMFGGGKTSSSNTFKYPIGYQKDGFYIHGKGRFPANIILDEESAQMLGEYSRFFYVAKASKKERGKDNNHPTVKPIALLEYLCTLTCTPHGGIVLDPFMGSGSTGIAAKNTQRDFIGIEIDQNYFEIAKKRIGG